MPKHTDFPAGALVMLVLRVLQAGDLHGYAIAQQIRILSSDVLQVEEGSLYPALQKMLLKGWVSAAWGVSETGRRVRCYRLTASGRKQLRDERAQHDLISTAIQAVLREA
jgi:PadR family transcriptional regulator, regulatory protein PadR